MIPNKKMNSFNDGVCGVYSEKSTLINNFNAKINAKTYDDYDFKKNIYYSIENIREEDFDFAERLGKKLTMKIKTPLVNDIEEKDKIIISNFVYDIIKKDPNIRNKELYLYLEGGRRIEESNQE